MNKKDKIREQGKYGYKNIKGQPQDPGGGRTVLNLDCGVGVTN